MFQRYIKKDLKNFSFSGTPTKSSVNNRMSPTNSGGGPSTGGEQTFTDRQFVVIASDKVARVVALPSHNCVYKQIITEVSFVVKAEIIQIKGTSLINIIQRVKKLRSSINSYENAHCKIIFICFFSYQIFLFFLFCESKK